MILYNIEYGIESREAKDDHEVESHTKSIFLKEGTFKSQGWNVSNHKYRAAR